MQIATWNVNSLRVRIDHVINWLEKTKCDILAIQELKLDNEANNKLIKTFADIGYNFVYNGQKTYNGVAIVSKHPITDTVNDIPDYADEQKRVICATINNIKIVCAYFVNGESLTSDKFKYKLEWLDKLTKYVKSLIEQHPSLILLGDFNIAPESRDTYEPMLWDGGILCSTQERQVFNNLLNMGLYDTFRHFNQQDKQFTWWDYRNMAFRRKQGLRIDHILATKPILEKATSCVIDIDPRKLDRPSDHTPVILTL